MMSYPLSYGVNPVSLIKSVALPIKVGDGVTISLDSSKFEKLKTFIERRHLLDDLSQINIRVNLVLFDDGTGWSGGNLMIPDPNNPNKFIPVDEKGRKLW